MLRLFKNELTKRLHRPGIYIILVLAIVFSIISGAMTKFLESGYLQSMEFLEGYELDESDYDLKDEDQLDFYIQTLTTKELNKLKKNYNYYSPEYYYIDNYMFDSVFCIKKSEYVKMSEKELNQCQSDYDVALANVKKFDFEKLLNEEKAEHLKSLNDKMSDSEREYIENQIKVIDYRIEEKVPETYKTDSTELGSYPDLVSQYNESKNSYKSEKELNDNSQSLLEVKYKMDHKMYTDEYKDGSASSLQDVLVGTNFMVTILVIIIAGTIVSEEFNKGTIKLLLARPFKRSSILISKILTILLFFVLFIIIYAIINTVIMGLFTGGFKTLLDPVLVYDYNIHEIVPYNLLHYCLLQFVAVLPKYLIITFFVFLINVLLTNSAISIAAGYVALFASTITSTFYKLKIVSYLPINCWDLSPYLFGGKSYMVYGSFTKSLVVSIITIVLLIACSIFIFNKKEIKNQ